MAQAKDWEAGGDYDKAIACYLKVAPPLTNDDQLMQRCYAKVCPISGAMIGHTGHVL